MSYSTVQLRRGMMLGASALALCLSAPAFAQTQAKDDEQTEEEDPGITVTGLRQSLASAQSIKVNSDQFVDSVTAIDIGALPDRNVAEALQRVSGIQITRNRGEGSSIAIRGLTQVRTEVNGRDSFGASGGRALGFEDVPSELLAGVDVYKNPSAELIEGGIGGLVNLRTRMPFDSKGLLVAATVGVNNYSLSDATTVNGSVLISNRWETGIGEIGILANVSYFKSNYRSDELVLEPYVSTSNLPVGQTGPREVTDGAGIATFFGDRERRGAYGAIQWAPGPDIEFYAQAFYSRYYIEGSNLGTFVTRGTDPQGVTGLTPIGTFEFASDGTFLRGGYDGIATNNNNQINFNISATADYSAGFKWAATENLRINADFQYIKASAENRNYSAFGNRDSGSYYVDLRGDVPQITFGPAGADNGANYYLIAVMDHKEDSNADQKTGRLDLEWDFDEDGPLRSFTAGVRYTDRSAVNRSTPYNWTFLSAPWAGNTAIPLSAYGTPNPFTDGFFGGQATVQTLPSFNYNLLFDPGPLFAELYTRAGPSCCGPTTRPLTDYNPLTDINVQDETTWTGYAMLRFGHNDALSGNIGIRVVRTENSASGRSVLTYRTTPTGSDIRLETPFSASQAYTSVLPSLNLKYKVQDGLQFRAAASRGLSRPPFYDMRALFNLSENYVAVGMGTPTLRDRTGGGGNPYLKPLEVTQADVAVEWFPNSSTMLYATAFYKDLTNFLTNAVYPLQADVPGKGTQTFMVTAQVNGTKGTVKGFEIGGNTFFSFLPAPFDGFGVQGNITYVDSDAPGAVGTLANGIQVPTTLQGLSKWSFNAVGMYEKGGFRLRVAYNWRDNYLDTISGNGTGAIPIYVKAYGQLDASVSYDISPNIGVTLDVVNLTNSQKIQYQNVISHPRKYQLDDRRIGFSIRLRN
ncbi:MAG: TonB-dependent receptor [Sphingomonas sp.]